MAGFDVLRDRPQVRRRISLTGQFAALDEAQTGEENLRMMGRLSRLSRAAARQRAAELLEQFELTAAGRRRVSTYSGGMRRRLDLATSLVGRPSVIFLDAGRLIAEGTPEELKQRVAVQRLDLTCVSVPAFGEVSRWSADRAVQLDPASLTVGVATDGSAAQVRALLDEADPGRALIASFAVRGATLDGVFLTLTGRAKEIARV